MKYSVDLFLKALAHRLKFIDKFFVCKTSSVEDAKFPARENKR